MTQDRVIRIAAAVIVDGAGRMLLVRKRGTRAFMQPGGKLDAGEDAQTALAREIAEELGCAVVHPLRPLGRFTAPAANEPDHLVEAELFAAEVAGGMCAAAEIEEMHWHPLAEPPGVPMAPLTEHHVLPLARAIEARA